MTDTVAAIKPKTRKGFDPFARDTATACDAGFEFEMKDPFTDEPTGAFITIAGKDGTIFRKAVREKANARIKAAALANRKGTEPETPTVEKAEADEIELLTACTLSWRGFDDGNGNDLPCTPENVRRLYAMEPYRKQADAALSDLGNFTPG